MSLIVVPLFLVLGFAMGGPGGALFGGIIGCFVLISVLADSGKETETSSEYDEPYYELDDDNEYKDDKGDGYELGNRLMERVNDLNQTFDDINTRLDNLRAIINRPIDMDQIRARINNSNEIDDINIPAYDDD